MDTAFVVTTQQAHVSLLPAASIDGLCSVEQILYTVLYNLPHTVITYKPYVKTSMALGFIET